MNRDAVGLFPEHARTEITTVSPDLGGRLDRVATAADRGGASVALYANVSWTS